MAKKKKVQSRAGKCIQLLWSFIHITLHLLRKGPASSRSVHLSVMEFHPYYTPPAQEVQQSIREDQFCSRKQQIVVETHIRQLKQLVVDYDLSTLRMAEFLCIQTLYIPRKQM